MKVIEWNTGRQYTAQGQQMRATMVDSSIYFVDMSRYVFGVIDTVQGEVGEHDIHRMVMVAYDNLIYRAPLPGTEDQVIRELRGA